MSPVDQELVDLYVEDNPGLGRNVIAAFIDAGMEPPSNERVRDRGFSAQENAVIKAYLVKVDPYGTDANIKNTEGSD